MDLGRRAVLLGLAAIAAAGCQMSPPRNEFPPLIYSQLGPIRLDVAQVDVIDQYAPTMALPNVEHLMPIAPADAVRRWAQDRLVPTGATGVARVVIRDASVRETPLPKTQGIQGAFTTDQDRRYDGRIDVEVEVMDSRGGRSVAGATVTRSTTTPEGTTLLQRDRIWYEMVERMMLDFNGQIERAIRENMSSALR
ncbi:MAG TPA: hypothetical protein VEH84_16095 [Alphaproteobacteria bacterium]|nr:hypothetical protein [Alphaproteobacteria bacterium]